MAKTRMNEQHRRLAGSFAREIIDCPGLRADLDEKYIKAAPLVRAVVEARFAPRDMRICKRYNVASVKDHIVMRSPDESVRGFDFLPERGPLVADDYQSSRMFDASPDAAAAVGDWIVSRDNHSKAVKEKFEDYRALIYAARTFEDMIDVWADAEGLREQICGRGKALTALNPDTIARIKSDVEFRALSA